MQDQLGRVQLLVRRTNDERNHGGSISSRSLQTFDQFFYFPYLDVLLCLVRLRSAHGERR